MNRHVVVVVFYSEPITEEGEGEAEPPHSEDGERVYTHTQAQTHTLKLNLCVPI